MRILYTVFIKLYWFLAILLYPFNSKAKKWVFGRLNWRDSLPSKGDKKRIWFHCASLGEFEMARPIFENLIYQENELVLSFFSPSGFEVRKEYPLAAFVFYLPIDTAVNAKDLINGLQPDLMVFVKYDVWPNLIKKANKSGIPQYLISAVFRESQIYFKPWGGLFREALRSFDRIFVQDENSKTILEEFNISSEVAGDVRFDRALEVVDSSFKDEFIFGFSNGKPTIVFGSTYDTEHLWIRHLIHELDHLHEDYRFIIAPHQIDSEHLHEVKEHFPNAYYYQKHHATSPKFESKILILDTIGMLTFVYRFSNAAYIGGGFGNSLHNSLEAAVYGIPVVVGPNHQKFPEVHEMVKDAGYIQVNNQEDFKTTIKRILSNSISLEPQGKLNSSFVKKRAGASKKITSTLKLKIGA